MPSKTSKSIVPLLFDTYIAAIKNSVGSRLFRNSYVQINGKKTDILQDGNLSCSFFISSILALFPLFQLIKHPPHATISGTIKDLKRSGWKEVKKLKLGSIILWEARASESSHVRAGHKHLGFYIGNRRAISNNSKLKMPQVHHYTFGTKKEKPVRRIEKIFWNKKFKK